MMLFTALEIETEPGTVVLDTPNSLCLCVPSGAWVLTSTDGSQAGYIEDASVTSFTSPDGIQSVEAGLPINEDLTKAQLQDIAAQLGLSTSGLKAEILAEIKAAIAEA